MLKDIFDPATTTHLHQRIDSLAPGTAPKWGTMNAGEMLAHCNVSYEMVFTDKHPKPNGFMKLLLRYVIKKGVVGPKPYPKNGRTAPVFLVGPEQDFKLEKKRIKEFISQTQELGASHFEGKESHSFGSLTATEWSNLFYKHLDHHLTQFGV